MPLFEFECEHCGDVVEKLMQSSAEADRASLGCERKSCPGYYRRVPSVANFALKGAGFHAVDYPRKDK